MPSEAAGRFRKECKVQGLRKYNTLSTVTRNSNKTEEQNHVLKVNKFITRDKPRIVRRVKVK
jgi:hypothetical protein